MAKKSIEQKLLEVLFSTVIDTFEEQFDIKKSANLFREHKDTGIHCAKCGSKDELYKTGDKFVCEKCRGKE